MVLITIEGIDGAGKTTAINALEQITDEPIVTTEPNDEEGYHKKWNTVNWFGEQVRQAISTDDVDPVSVFFYFLADHAHHYKETIKPALESGNTVLCDRYIGSRYAYQSLSLDDRIHGDSLSYLSNLHESELKINTDHPIVQELLQTAIDEIPSRLQAETPLISKYAYGLAEHPEVHPKTLSTPDFDFPGLNVTDDPASWSKLPDYTILLDIPASVAIERLGGEGDEVFEKKQFLDSVRQQYLSVAERNPERVTVIDATQSKQTVRNKVKESFTQYHNTD